MGDVIKVGMADLKTGKGTDVLTTLGLGSCIGLTFYDPTSKIGGLVHYMLPDSTKLKNNSNIAKFGDTGIRELYNQVIAMGASKYRLVAKIAGGAKMFEVSGLSGIGNVGDRNAEAAKKILKELGVKEDDLAKLALDCSRNKTRSLIGYKPLAYEDILVIYQMAYERG